MSKRDKPVYTVAVHKNLWTYFVPKYQNQWSSQAKIDQLVQSQFRLFCQLDIIRYIARIAFVGHRQFQRTSDRKLRTAIGKHSPVWLLHHDITAIIIISIITVVIIIFFSSSPSSFCAFDRRCFYLGNKIASLISSVYSDYVLNYTWAAT